VKNEQKKQNSEFEDLKKMTSPHILEGIKTLKEEKRKYENRISGLKNKQLKIQEEIDKLKNVYQKRYGIDFDKHDSISEIIEFSTLQAKFLLSLISKLEPDILDQKGIDFDIEIEPPKPKQIKKSKDQTKHRLSKQEWLKLDKKVLKFIEKRGEIGTYLSEIANAMNISKAKIKKATEHLLNNEKIIKTRNPGTHINKLVDTIFKIPSKEDLGTIVVIDLPNIINSYRKETQNKMEKKSKRKSSMRITPKIFDPIIIKELLLKYTQDYNNIKETKIFTTPFFKYLPINEFLTKFKEEKPELNIKVEIINKWDGKKYEDVDYDMDQYLGRLYKQNKENQVFSRLLIFGGDGKNDRLIIPKLLDFAEMNIEIQIIAHEDCISKSFNRFFKYNKENQPPLFSEELFNNTFFENIEG